VAHYIVSYDLHKERVYQPVWNKLEGWGATRLLESLWVLTSNLTASQIRDGIVRGCRFRRLGRGGRIEARLFVGHNAS
jgi:hypothetical protein